MTRRARIAASSLVLAHVPDLARYGSKPSREPDRIQRLRGSLRDFKEAVAYPPNQVRRRRVERAYLERSAMAPEAKTNPSEELDATCLASTATSSPP